MADETHDTPPLSDERLAEIRANQIYYHSYMNGPTSGECAEMYGPDVDDLLAEVDRLRGREAAAMAILADVAKTEPYYSEQPEGWWCTMCDGWQPEAWSPYSDGGKSQFQHDKNCPVTKARALLAQE